MPVYNFKCSKCGHIDSLEIPISGMEKLYRCPRCGKKSFIRQFTPCMNMAINFKDGPAADKKLKEMKKEIERRQDSVGYGPTVDYKRETTRRKPLVTETPEPTGKQMAKKYKQIKRGE